MRRFDILGIGENATDTVIELPHFPALGSKLELSTTRNMLGGQLATAMLACQHWGLRTHYVGTVGDDSAGALHQSTLTRAGVSTHLVRVPRCLSHHSLILLDKCSGERTILWSRDPRLALSPSHLKRSWITSARLLYIDGHDPEATSVAARWARQAAIPVLGDFDHFSEALRCVLPLVDYAVTSRNFPQEATGEKNLLRALPFLLSKFRFRVICCTLGVDGALAWNGQRFWYAPSNRVRVVDTTGAGDLFHAGFSYGVLQSWDWDRILDFSCAAAGLNCMALGARGGICSLRKVKTMQKSRRRNPCLFSAEQLARAATRAHQIILGQNP
jgi:sugar/nucleoside kinase (ribokinase family)